MTMLFQLSYDIRRSGIISGIIIAAVMLSYGVGILSDHPYLQLLVRIAIVVGPLAVGMSCFLTARRYENSKIFGRSYLLLGVGYLATFTGEIIFFHYVDSLEILDYVIFADMLILASYPFMASHILINVRYFADRISMWQWMLLAGVIAVILLAYFMMLHDTYDDPNSLWYYLMFVVSSSIVLGLAAIAFTMFRQTVLISAWLVLLVGIAVGTIGDVMYNYVTTLGVYSYDYFSNALWIASTIIMVYALYEHRRDM